MISSSLDMLSLICLAVMFVVGIIIFLVRQAPLGYISVALFSFTWVLIATLPLFLNIQYSKDLWYASPFHRNLLLTLPGIIIIISFLDRTWKSYIGVAIALCMTAILAVIFYL